MTDIGGLSLLFLSAFTSATLLPGSSEVTLLALLAGGQATPALLFAVATLGNVLGSTLNWALGRCFSAYRERRWFPVTRATQRAAEAWFKRYGVWSLLLAWVPVIGDPITVVAGLLRVGLLRFLLLVTLAKAGRYGVIVVAFHLWNAR